VKPSTLTVIRYQTLVDPDTTVDVNTAMVAAGCLQSLIDTRAGQPDIVDMMAKVNRIIEAVKSTVPQSMWGEIADKLDRPELEHSAPFDEGADDSDDADDAFDPIEFIDEDDEI
jgi:hypothetical protein